MKGELSLQRAHSPMALKSPRDHCPAPGALAVQHPVSDNGEDESFDQERFTPVAVCILPLMARNVAKVDIPEARIFADAPGLLQRGDRGGGEVSKPMVRKEARHMPGCLGAEVVPDPGGYIPQFIRVIVDPRNDIGHRLDMHAAVLRLLGDAKDTFEIWYMPDFFIGGFREAFNVYPVDIKKRRQHIKGLGSYIAVRHIVGIKPLRLGQLCRIKRIFEPQGRLIKRP